MFNDLREFIKQVEQLGEVRVVEGADWDLEIGRITELALSDPKSPLLVFDKIKGYPAGYRVVTNFLNSPKRLSMALGLPLYDKEVDLVKAWRDLIKQGFKPIPPVEVKSGPVKENILVGDDVDLFKFPAPKWHELDGGRYIGTGHMVIQRDPDEGWVNAGAYRVQIHDKSIATIHIVPGRHGRIIASKYWDRGLSCPTVVVCGEDPLLWRATISDIPWGESEYDYAGWLRNKPVEVVRGETVDLPIPATAEIALEGELVSPEVETQIEGPFGEWEGYYATGARPEPVFKVKAILHRNEPIITGAPPTVAAFDYEFGGYINRTAFLWNELDKHVPGVKGVRLPPETRSMMSIISLKQQYPGHAKQAAMLASGVYGIGTAQMSRFTVIVDDDIDPNNMSEVLWAIVTRCDPATSIDIIDGCWGAGSDPRLDPEKRERGDLTCSKAIIYACKPYSWIKQFPPSIKSSPEVLAQVQKKWGKVISGKP